MKLISKFCGFMLILATVKISEAYICKECKVGLQVLKFFHPPYSKKVDVGVCKDPCKMNRNFTDPVKIEAARDSIYQCSRVKVSCNEKAESEYRTIDGSCNNLQNPSWGMSDNCHRILLPHDYSDGVSSPRKSCLGTDLPPARVISNALHRETEIVESPQTLHFMEWGQTIAHDIAMTPLLPGITNEFCCYPDLKTDGPCMSEAIPPDDPTYAGKRTCMAFLRTVPCPLCNSSTREALNEFTSYFDLSLLYGNNDDLAQKLRSNADGMLKTQYIQGVGELPPPTQQDASGYCKALDNNHQCFFAGDIRIAQNPFITVTHIILLRHHNDICQQLKSLNPHWDDEKLYQEARRINIAQAQYITYAKYLPNVLGHHLMAEFQLEVLPGNQRTKYNSQMDGTTIDEVAAGAHRYGHSFIPDFSIAEDPETQENSTVNLMDYFFFPFDYYNGLLDSLAFGMTMERARTHNLFYASSVRDQLLHRRNKTYDGLDLAATSIARGRDHGLPGYSYYLKELFNHDVKSFCDLRRFMPFDTIRRMREIYESVYDIDLYTGGLAEYKVKGSILGPTFTAMIIMQSLRMKFADRYYFEHGNEAGSFTEAQLLEIKQTSFSKIICETTKVSEIQLDVFFPPSKHNPVMSCDSIPKLDLSPWLDNEKKASRKVGNEFY